MVTGKRSAELVELGDDAGGHRRALDARTRASFLELRAAPSRRASRSSRTACGRSRSRRRVGNAGVVRALDRAVRARHPPLRAAARAGPGRRARRARALRPGAARHRAPCGRCSFAVAVHGDLTLGTTPSCSPAGAAPRRPRATVHTPRRARRGRRPRSTRRDARGVIAARPRPQLRRRRAERGRRRRAVHRPRPRARARRREGLVHRRSGRQPRHADARARCRSAGSRWSCPARATSRSAARSPPTSTASSATARSADYVERMQLVTPAQRRRYASIPTDTRRVLGDRRRHGPHRRRHRGDDAAPAGRDVAHDRVRHRARARRRRLHGAHARERRPTTATRSRGSTASRPGRHLGRSVLTRGNHATLDELPSRRSRGHRRGRVRTAAVARAHRRGAERPAQPTVDPRVQRAVVPQGAAARRGQHPGDQARSSSRSTACAVGTASTGRAASCSTSSSCRTAPKHVVRDALERLSAARVPSFLAVLKRFEHDEPSAARLPDRGLDARARHPGERRASSATLLDGLDELVADAGGRVYLTKDSRLAPELLAGDVSAARPVARGPGCPRPRRTCCAATWTAGSTSPAYRKEQRDEGRARDRCSRSSCSAAVPTSRSRRATQLVGDAARARRARGAQARSARRRVAGDLRAAGAAAVDTVAFDATDFASHEAFVRTTFDRFGDFDVVLVAFGVLGDQELRRARRGRRARDRADELHRRGVGHGPARRTAARSRDTARSCCSRRSRASGSAARTSSTARRRPASTATTRASATRSPGSGVHVMIVRPGFVHTKMTAGHEAGAAVDDAGAGRRRDRARPRARHARPCGCRRALRFVMIGPAPPAAVGLPPPADLSDAVPRTVAAFDFDGTLTRRDTLVAVPRVGRRLAAVVAAASPRAPRVARRRSDGRPRRGQGARCSRAARRTSATTPCRGPASEYGARSSADKLAPEMRERLAWHRHEGHESCSCRRRSTCTSTTVGPDARGRHVLCTELEVDGNGALHGPDARRELSRRRRRRAACARTSARRRRRLWAYGDSARRRRMLAMADHPVVRAVAARVRSDRLERRRCRRPDRSTPPAPLPRYGASPNACRRRRRARSIT